MARFEEAINYLLQDEGGLVDNENDPGGVTKYGLSQRAYPQVDIRNLTREQAEAIYRRDYWHFDGIWDQRVATKIFDAYVNRKATIRQAQIAAGTTPVDGIYGGNTEHAINAMNPNQFLENFVNGLIQEYQEIVQKNPAEGIFLVGWLNRARRLPN